MMPRVLAIERCAMAFALRVLAASAALLLGAGYASAGLQLFEGSWVVKAFGNDRTGGTGESEFYSAIGLPFGQQCNPYQPRCPFESTPTDGSRLFHALGGGTPAGPALFCIPWYDFNGRGTDERPRKSSYYSSGSGGMNYRTRPPLYRNPAFFTPSGNPNVTRCDARSTSLGGFGSLGGGRGVAQRGSPITGKGLANAIDSGSAMRGFSLPAAPHSPNSIGIRGTGIVGELPFESLGDLPFLSGFAYRYIYATLRNDAGRFGTGLGPGSFSVRYPVKSATVAMVKARQGAAKFGGTMRMLGAIHTKSCLYRAGGCSRGRRQDFYYDAIGAGAVYTDGAGAITKGYQALGSAVYFNTALGQFSTVLLEGSRFPWTTGSVTVTAARGRHKTVHYAMGYDNRTQAGEKGTIQLVSPVLTHWLLPGASHETAGIGILRIKFVPEPGAWVMLAAGASILALACRRRSR